MSKKKTTATAAKPAATKPRKVKAKDFPRIAEALTQPLPTPEAASETTPEVATEAVPEAAPEVTSDAPTETEVKVAKVKKNKRKAGEPQPKKLGALNAAAQVLAANGGPMNCQAMIDAMAAQGLWTSPGGQTPAATLYSAILREVAKKGDQARFMKTERGHFAHTGV